MVNNEFNVVPLYTTSKCEEVGLKLNWDDKVQMYVYTETDEDVSENETSMYQYVWSLSPTKVEEYIENGLLTTTDPNKPKVDPTYEEVMKEVKEDCDVETEESISTYLQSDLMYRVLNLEDKLDQVLELLNQKTKKK